MRCERATEDFRNPSRYGFSYAKGSYLAENDKRGSSSMSRHYSREGEDSNEGNSRTPNFLLRFPLIFLRIAFDFWLCAEWPHVPVIQTSKNTWQNVEGVE